MPNITKIIDRELLNYPRGTKVFACREYDDRYIFFVGQKGTNGKMWGGSSFPTVLKRNGELSYTDIFDIPQSGFREVNYKTLKEV